MKRFRDRLRFLADHRWAPPRASEYLDGELGSEQRARFDRHLEQCPECRELLRSLRSLLGALGTISGEDGTPVGATILASVQSRLGELPREQA